VNGAAIIFPIVDHLFVFSFVQATSIFFVFFVQKILQHSNTYIVARSSIVFLNYETYFDIFKNRGPWRSGAKYPHSFV
jgi:hypothetical protein